MGSLELGGEEHEERTGCGRRGTIQPHGLNLVGWARLQQHSRSSHAAPAFMLAQPERNLHQKEWSEGYNKGENDSTFMAKPGQDEIRVLAQRRNLYATPQLGAKPLLYSPDFGKMYV